MYCYQIQHNMKTTLGRIKLLCFGVLLLSLFSPSAYAFFDRRSSEDKSNEIALDEGRVVHMRLSSREHDAFLDLMRRRATLQRQLEVLQELLDEKDRERNVLLQQSNRQESRTENSKRHKLPDDKEQQEEDTSIAANGETPAHRRFAFLEERIENLQSGLQIIVTQKKRQWDRLYQRLFDEFSIHPNQDYHYDIESMVIYRIVQDP